MCKRATTLLVLVCAALLAAIPAVADTGNQKTTLTFSNPVELPGIVLPAGTYVFKLVETTTYRHVIQVSNDKEDTVFATLLAVPDYRLTPTADTVVYFAERPTGRPQAIRGWFYPGRHFGHEFVYPKVRATELAKEMHVAVPTAEVTPTEKPAELQQAPVAAMTPESKEVEIATAVEMKPQAPEAPAPVAAPAPAAPAELPKTASPLPLIALFGVFALGVAVALKRVVAKNHS